MNECTIDRLTTSVQSTDILNQVLARGKANPDFFKWKKTHFLKLCKDISTLRKRV